MPLLCRWSELCVMAEKAVEAMRTEGMIVEGKASPWVGIHQSATKGLNVLALRLRLGPQSRMARTPKTIPNMVSYYERAKLESADDEEASQN